MWNVYVNNVRVKSYPYKLQACIYCWMNGYVYSGIDDWTNRYLVALDERVRIEESLDEDKMF